MPAEHSPLLPEAQTSPSGSAGSHGGGAGAVAIFDREGNETGQVQLPEAIFGAPVNGAVLHQAVLRQQANDRQGTHQTKTRGDVSGGGKKPWKQKGTGRARQGSTRAPQWRHGGTVFGPHPRSYEQKMPRKQRRAALRGALSAKHQDGAVRVIEELTLEEPKTRVVADLFAQMETGALTLLVIREHDLNLEKSTRNLTSVKTILASNLNPGDVLTADTIVFTRSALSDIEEWLS
jgi:large subunit ribosomal protein L4